MTIHIDIDPNPEEPVALWDEDDQEAPLSDFDEEGRYREQRDRMIQKKEQGERVRRNFIDLKTRGGNHTPEIEKQFEWAEDQNDIRARLSIQELMAMHYDLSLEEVNQRYDANFIDYANQFFEGKLPKTNEEFWHAEKARIEKKEEVAVGYLEMQEQAHIDATRDAVSGAPPNWGGKFGQWRGKDVLGRNLATKLPPEQLLDGYAETYRNTFKVMTEFRAIVDVLASMQGREDLMLPEDSELRGTGWDAAVEQLIAEPREKQEAFFSAMSLYLRENLPDGGADARMATFTRQIRERVALGTSNLVGKQAWNRSEHEWGNDALEALQEEQDVRMVVPSKGAVPDNLITPTMAALLNVGNYSGIGYKTIHDFTPLSAAERKKVTKELTRRDRLYRGAIRLDQLRQEMRPLEMVSPFPAVEGAIYALAKTAPQLGVSMAVNLLPGGMIFAFGISAYAIRGQEYDQILLEHPDVSSRELKRAATMSAMAQALIESLGIKGLKAGGSLVLKKVPTVGRVLEEAALLNGRFSSPFLNRVIVDSAEQFTEAIAQGMLSSEIKKAILKDHPNASLKDAFFENATLETLFAGLFLVLPASGVGSWVDNPQMKQGLQSMDDLRGLGFSPDQANPIIALARKGDFAGSEKLLQEKYKGLTDEQVKEGLRHIQFRLDLAKNLSGDPDLAHIATEGGGYVLVEPDGSVSGRFKNQEMALRQYGDRMAWERAQHMQTVRDYAAWFRARQEGRVFELPGRTRRGSDKLAEKPFNEEALAASMQMARVDAGADPAMLVIRGEAGVDLRDEVRRDVVKLYDRADFTTVIEENTHAQLNADLHEGRVTWDEAAAWAREWSEETGVDLADAKHPTKAEIHEAVADMAKAHFLNERKKLPDSPKVRGLMGSIREYLHEVLGRAKTLIELRESGRLSEGAESYLTRTLGTSEQVSEPSASSVSVGDAKDTNATTLQPEYADREGKIYANDRRRGRPKRTLRRTNHRPPRPPRPPRQRRRKKRKKPAK